MATTYRLRYNLLYGTLGAALTNADTAITFAAALKEGGPSGTNIATLGVDEYLPLTIDDEVVYLTAYTSGATTGTITRGNEGTVAAAHANGANFVSAPSKLDIPAGWLDRGVFAASTPYRRGDIFTYGSHRFLVVSPFTSGSTFNPSQAVPLDALTVDNPATWTTATAEDQEFDGTGSALPSGWSWFNQGTATSQLDYGALTLSFDPAATGIILHGVVRAVPAASTWTMTAKLGLGAMKATRGVGIILRESATAKSVLFGTSDDFDLRLMPWTSDTAAGTDLTTASPTRISSLPSYYRLRRNSATSWDTEWSPDGVAWFKFDSARNLGPNFTTAPDQIGFAAYANTNLTPIQASCHFVRVR